jgi:hypothetical protein
MPQTRSYILIITGVILIISAFVLNTPFILPRELWLVLGLLSLCAGILFLLKQKFTAATTPNTPPKDWEKLRQSGHHISINLDNCEVKQRSFQQDAQDEFIPSQSASIDALFQPQSSSGKQDIQQTYIVVEEVFNGIPYKFVSYPTPLDPVTVKMRIDQRGGDLFIDKANPSIYFFQLPF